MKTPVPPDFLLQTPLFFRKKVQPGISHSSKSSNLVSVKKTKSQQLINSLKSGNLSLAHKPQTFKLAIFTFSWPSCNAKYSEEQTEASEDARRETEHVKDRQTDRQTTNKHKHTDVYTKHLNTTQHKTQIVKL